MIKPQKIVLSVGFNTNLTAPGVPLRAIRIPKAINDLPVSYIGDYIFLDTPVKNVYLPDTDIHISDAAFDYFGGTVWLSAKHPTLKFVMAIVNRDTYQIEYYRDTETTLSAPTFRYWIEINDYVDDEE